MNVWLVIQQDRHTDVAVHPFSTENRALLYAEQLAADLRPELLPAEDDMMLTQAMIEGDWVFYLPYGSEGDHIRVIRREMDRKD